MPGIRIDVFLVFWYTRIYIVAPPQDSADQIPHAESCRFELTRRIGTAFARATVDDHVARLVDGRHRRGNGAERYELRRRKTRDVPLVWLAHIDELKIVPARQPLLQLARRQLGHSVRIYRRGTARRAAILVVVDQGSDLV